MRKVAWHPREQCDNPENGYQELFLSKLNYGISVWSRIWGSQQENSVKNDSKVEEFEH